MQIKDHNALIETEEKSLAPYAMRSLLCQGRVHPEEEDPYRLPFQRDRDRIIHSKAFRRLQAKTQVFVAFYGDHFRDRLTHTLEVSQIARDISRGLGLNEDLAECLSLAHDLGHPPFGHGGQEALDGVMREHGLKFEHNEQSRRIIEKLEKTYPDFDGLNPTKEVLDGLLKHHPHSYKTYLDFSAAPHLEGQVMDLADEIAYIAHDIDDGLRAGLFGFTEVSKLELWQMAEKLLIQKYGSGITKMDTETRRRYGSRMVSMLISLMIIDLQTATLEHLKINSIDSLQKVREFPDLLVRFSPRMRTQIDQVRDFLSKNFYTNPRVAVEIERGCSILKGLFNYYFDNQDFLPGNYRQLIINGERAEIVIKDYLAGMTDHFAVETWQSLSTKN